MAAKGLRVLVCGGRDFANRDLLWAALDAIHARTPFACAHVLMSTVWLQEEIDLWTARRGVPLALIDDRKDLYVWLASLTDVDLLIWFAGEEPLYKRALRKGVRALRVETLRDAGVDVEAETTKPAYHMREAAKPDAGWLPDGAGPWRSGRQTAMKGRE